MREPAGRTEFVEPWSTSALVIVTVTVVAASFESGAASGRCLPPGSRKIA